MTDAEKIQYMSVMTGETDEAKMSVFLTLAGQKILEKVYPFGIPTDEEGNPVEVPSKYHWTQIEVANFLVNKIGAEGETFHSENGVQRTYEKASVPESMLRNVVPYAKAVGSSENA